MKHQIETPHEALSVALALAITAPTQRKANLALVYVNEFAAGMSPRELNRAKAAAMILAATWRSKQIDPARN